MTTTNNPDKEESRDIIDLALEQIDKNKKQNNLKSSDLKKYFSGIASRQTIDQIKSRLQITDLEINNENIDMSHQWDQSAREKLLTNIKSVTFTDCFFFSKPGTLGLTKTTFTNCTIDSNWDLLPSETNDSEYHNCIFLDEVEISGTFFHKQDEVDKESIKTGIDISTFDSCQFKKGMSLSVLESIIRNDHSESKPSNTTHLKITHCNLPTTDFLSTFSAKKIEISESSVDNLKIVAKTDASSLRLSLCDINSKLNIEQSNIDKLHICDCHIHCPSAITRNIINFACISMTSFHDQLSFQGTTFSSGLEISTMHNKYAPNFLGSFIGENNSSRETFRIIKNSFDSVGNFIEGNKFYSMEMKKMADELKLAKNPFDLILYNLNRIASRNGQSFVLPLYWIITLSLLRYQARHENIPFIKKILQTNPVAFLNEVTNGLTPLSKYLTPNYEFVSLIYYISIAGLLWHTVVAIKRRTKR